MGSFCVAPQRSEDMQNYELRVDLQSAPGASVSLFLFGDEGDAYGRFWKDAIANKVSVDIIMVGDISVGCRSATLAGAR